MGSEAQYFTTDFPITLKFNPALLRDVWLMPIFKPRSTLSKSNLDLEDDVMVILPLPMFWLFVSLNLDHFDKNSIPT